VLLRLPEQHILGFNPARPETLQRTLGRFGLI